MPQPRNCYKEGEWDKDLCPDPATCSSNCHLEGISQDGPLSPKRAYKQRLSSNIVVGQCRASWGAGGGPTEDQYRSTYGITTIGDGMTLNFVTKTQYGSNFGSRVYMLDDSSHYKLFKLKNRAPPQQFFHLAAVSFTHLLSRSAFLLG